MPAFLREYGATGVFVALGVWRLIQWRRRRLRLPWFVHALAAFCLVCGLAIVVGNPEMSPLDSVLLPPGMALFVYVGFGARGPAIMRRRDADREAGAG
jgi:hypothetical protein